ncbi:neuronal acetylcholine receptor subunit alpha-6-like [Planococcus citri]|uniref:neuronal acetylcholine receptor subunit alpha-6-like n=1 Tax=Planococcus citri TaxID=170843 RepID=UPI0031F84E07
MQGDIFNLRILFTSCKSVIICWWIFNGICLASVKEIRDRNKTEKEKLRHDLLLNYDSYALPDYKNSNEVDVLMLFNFAELDYQKNIISINGITVLSWRDKRLKWEPSKYGNIENLGFDNDEIWKPDLALYNTADTDMREDFGKTNIACHYNGSLTWVAPALFRAFCPLDVLHWPFDTQICDLKFGSWTYDRSKIDLKMRDLGNPSDRAFSSEWIIKKVTSKKNTIFYQCCPEAYVDITYSVKVHRKHSSFKMFILFPAFVISLLTLSLFWIPYQSSIKFILAATTMVLSSLLLSFYGDKVPIMLHKVPLIVRFYDNVFCLCVLYMIFCAVTYVIAEPEFRCRNPIPSAAALFLDSFIVNYLIFPSEKNLRNTLTTGSSEENGHNPIIENDIEVHVDRVNGVEWYLIFIMINRALFVIYTIILVILLFRIILLIES